MNLINSIEIRKIKEARKIIDEQQRRIFQLERILDDLARASEIAQYSQQYHVVETYRVEAEEALVDRIVVPELEHSAEDLKIRVITGEVSPETNKAINDHITAKAEVAAGAKV